MIPQLWMVGQLPTFLQPNTLLRWPLQTAPQSPSPTHPWQQDTFEDQELEKDTAARELPTPIQSSEDVDGANWQKETLVTLPSLKQTSNNSWVEMHPCLGPKGERTPSRTSHLSPPSRTAPGELNGGLTRLILSMVAGIICHSW